MKNRVALKLKYSDRLFSLPGRISHACSVLPKFGVIFLFFCTLSGNLLASDHQFEQANQAYSKANYNFAIEQYEAILADGNYSPDLYYNLGNAYFKTGKLGKAILNYERTLVLQPSNKDAQTNLSIAKVRTEDLIQPLPPFFLARWWRTLRDGLSSTTWSGLSILLLWLSLGGFSVWLLGKLRGRKKQGFVVGIMGLLLFLLVFMLASQRAKTEAYSGYAIIIEKATSLKDAATADSPEIFQLHEGTKVQLLDQIDNWYKVKLANGEQGWLLDGVFELI